MCFVVHDVERVTLAMLEAAGGGGGRHPGLDRRRGFRGKWRRVLLVTR